MAFNSYIVPLVLSVLVIWSLRYQLSNRNFITKSILSFIISIIVIFFYKYAHYYFNNNNDFSVGFMPENDIFVGTFIIFLFNMAALWVFTKNIKIRN